jgi:hypothetical protein
MTTRDARQRAPTWTCRCKGLRRSSATKGPGDGAFRPAQYELAAHPEPADSTPQPDQDTTEQARTFVQDVLGKQAIDCQDRARFIVNALLVPFILSAIRMNESGFASAEHLDEGLG